jgi:pimeloyl-ACP methyl ester carboxylesterase
MSMAHIDIGGIGIAYEILGDGPQTIAITPGGRFSKDTPGVRPLAEALAAAGKRVLIWDRPNTGGSDICFDGATESVQNADTLAGLLRALDLGPAMLVGGSGGARDSILTTIRHPDVVERLFVLWISGGPIGLASVAAFYCADAATAAVTYGMEAVAALPGWRDLIERTPANRDRLLAWDAPAFVDKMQDWCQAFFPREGAPMPGLTPAELAGIAVPVTVLRSGVSDLHHSRETSEAVAALIPGAHIAEPPWGDREWMEALAAAPTGRGLFTSWPLLAPQILAFVDGN